MPLIETTGSGSAKALGLNSASGPVNYIEDVFSTYLVTTPGGSYTVPSGIDFTKDGGLVWTKDRTLTSSHYLYGKTGTGNFVSELSSNNTNAASTGFTFLTALSNGFTDNVQTTAGRFLVHWQFRKQAKFFDVVTYTGNGAASQTISHNLGSVPGCIIVKAAGTTASSVQDWQVYHRSLGATKALFLNQSAAENTGTGYWNDTAPTSTNFTVGSFNYTNFNGVPYVAYIFAHDAGGFGLTGTDNVISCGSYTGGAGGIANINLGYEPQFVITKLASGTDPSGANDWYIVDNMRGWTVNASTGNATLSANTSSAEVNPSTVKYLTLNATGFKDTNCSSSSSTTYIYIAIRRGPMKTPTSGTSVFSPQLEGGTAGTKITTSFPIDWQLIKGRSSAQTTYGITRLTGVSSTTTEAAGNLLQTASTAAELADSTATRYWDNTGFQVPSGFAGGSSTFYITENFRRAPSFFDVVCYTGTGVARTINHNLGVAPEMMIIKDRTPGGNEWAVYAAPLGNQAWLSLNRDYAATTSNPIWNNTTPTSSVFSVGVAGDVNGSGYTLVAYLFASCPGVSKVGSYSGTGATQTISCGFAARFVMIKRTDSTGSWWVWDTARGMVAGTDPRIALNSATAETNANWVYADASGFQIVTTDATVNASGGSYIYLAIA